MVVLGIGGAIVLFVILGILGIIPIFKSSTSLDPNFPTGKVTLQVWGVGDETSAFAALGSAYQAQPVSKDVSIQYTKFDSADAYEKALTQALAEGRGPDVFMVKNDWIPKDAAKTAPAPLALVTPLMVQQAFPQAVAKDVILTATDNNQYVYALPLEFDALALLYNKDLLNARAVVYPPATWDDVIKLLPTLREADAQKNITISPIALGSAYTIQNFDDILSLLMLQSGSLIVAQNGMMLDGPAQQAIAFYMQFANPANVNYAWNDSLGDARSAFATGKAAMIIDTHDAIAEILKKNNFINIGTAPVPQLSAAAQNAQTLASYWNLAVSRQSKQPYVAWHFVRFAAMSPDVDAAYLQATGKLPALLSLINQNKEGADSAFLKSFLIAKTWARKDNEMIKNTWANMLDNIALGKTDLAQGARIAQDEINSQ